MLYNFLGFLTWHSLSRKFSCPNDISSWRKMREIRCICISTRDWFSWFVASIHFCFCTLAYFLPLSMIQAQSSNHVVAAYWRKFLLHPLGCSHLRLTVSCNLFPSSCFFSDPMFNLKLITILATFFRHIYTTTCRVLSQVPPVSVTL